MYSNSGIIQEFSWNQKLFLFIHIYLFKVNNRNTRTRCEVCLKLTLQTPEWRLWHEDIIQHSMRCFDVFWLGSLWCVYIVNFEFSLLNVYLRIWILWRQVWFLMQKDLFYVKKNGGRGGQGAVNLIYRNLNNF